MNIAQVDIKLLVVFDAVMTERSVTRAARRVGMSQPALSNALSRLRHILRDDLFVRGVEGMRPTPRALELAVPVGQALRQLQLAIEPRRFVPAEAQRTFRLAASPHAAAIVLPPLLQRLQTEAPGIELHVRPKANRIAPSLLDHHEVDFVLGILPNPPKRLSTVALFEDCYVCICRADHPLAHQDITLDAFTGAKHLLISPTGEASNLLDDCLAERGLRRDIRMTVNSDMAGVPIILATYFVTAVLSRLVKGLSAFGQTPLVAKTLPLPSFEVTLTWHSGLSNHPAHDWLRQTIIDVCAKLPPLQRGDE